MLRQLSATLPWTGATETFFCQICFETQESSKAVTLNCGHKFCTSCYTDYLHSKVTILLGFPSEGLAPRAGTRTVIPSISH
jgi:Zinc finger, C3HC4 type (RING finger)